MREHLAPQGSRFALVYSVDELAVFEVTDGAVESGGVAVDDPAGETADSQFVGSGHVVERVGDQLVRGQADALAVLAGQTPPSMRSCSSKNSTPAAARGRAKVPAGLVVTV